MRLKVLIVVATLLIVGIAVYLYRGYDNEKRAKERAAAVKAAQEKPEPISMNSSVEPNKVLSLWYEIPHDRTPGTMTGEWSSKGSSAKIKGAADDSLVAFKLLGPNGEEIQKLDHPTKGVFSVRLAGPGRVTFLFDNAGILRSTSRIVEVHGTYYPDKK